MFNMSAPSLADIAAVTRNNNGDDGWGRKQWLVDSDHSVCTVWLGQRWIWRWWR